MNERTKEVLKAHGISAEILNEPNTDKRAEAIQKLEDKGARVVITNMKLVEVGLDLLYWPTIINNQMSYEVPVFRQSNRRHWRIGQNKECRCYTLVYNGTQQMSQFLTVMSGRGHAMLTEGRLDTSELAEFARDGQTSLASDLAACFADNSVADSWVKLAEKDLASIETVAEESFKQVISERMEALANETRRLCGVDVVGSHTNISQSSFPSASYAMPIDISPFGNVSGWENDDLFGSLTGWDNVEDPFRLDIQNPFEAVKEVVLEQAEWDLFESHTAPLISKQKTLSLVGA
ncbi:hypothetical protein AAAC51_07170 [Priestia megaterium]